MTQELITIQAAEVAATKKTFNSFVEEWLTVRAQEGEKKALKPKTIATYRYNLKVFKNWLDGEGITEPGKDDITAFKNFMTAQGWKVSTKNLYLASVRSFYKWLSDNYHFDNVTAGFDGWKTSKEHKRGFLNLNDMKKLLNAVDPFVAKKVAAAKKKFEAQRTAAEKRGSSFNYDARLKSYEKTARLQGLRDKAILAALMANRNFPPARRRPYVGVRCKLFERFGQGQRRTRHRQNFR